MADSPTHSTDPIRRILLRLPNRRRAYECIVATPGTHARRMSRDLGMALGIVEHHLRQLERHGLVFSHQAGRRRTYYAMGQVDDRDAPLIHALRKPGWGVVAAALLADVECGVGTLAGRLDLPASTVSYNLRRMRDAGLLQHVQVGRESVYVVRDAARVSRILAHLHLEAQGGAPDATFAGVVARAAPPAIVSAARGARAPRPADGIAVGLAKD